MEKDCLKKFKGEMITFEGTHGQIVSFFSMKDVALFVERAKGGSMGKIFSWPCGISEKKGGW